MFQGSPHHAVLPAGLGWPAHAQKEKPRVSMQNIYFCDCTETEAPTFFECPSHDDSKASKELS